MRVSGRRARAEAWMLTSRVQRSPDRASKSHCETRASAEADSRRDRDVHLHCARRQLELRGSKRGHGEWLANWRASRTIESSRPHIRDARSVRQEIENPSVGPPRGLSSNPTVGDGPPGATGRRRDVDGRCRRVRQIVCEKSDPALVRREPLVEEIALRIRRDDSDIRIAGLVRARDRNEARCVSLGLTEATGARMVRPSFDQSNPCISTWPGFVNTRSPLPSVLKMLPRASCPAWRRRENASCAPSGTTAA